MSDHYKRDNRKADFLILLKSEILNNILPSIKTALISQSFLFITTKELAIIPIGGQKE